MKTKSLILTVLVLIFSMFVSSCSDADVASQNISRAAEQFEIYRRVVFLNGITDKYILCVEGYCSVDEYNNQLAVTVKTESGAFLKHYLGLSDNVTYFSEQIQPAAVSDKKYRVIFKPSVIVPNIDME